MTRPRPSSAVPAPLPPSGLRCPFPSPLYPGQAKQTAKEATGGWRSFCGVRVRVACGTLGVCLSPRRCNIPKLPGTECERARERGRVPGGQPQLIGVWQSGDASPSPASLCPFVTPIAQYLGGLCKWHCRIQRRNRKGKKWIDHTTTTKYSFLKQLSANLAHPFSQINLNNCFT